MNSFENKRVIISELVNNKEIHFTIYKYNKEFYMSLIYLDQPYSKRIDGLKKIIKKCCKLMPLDQRLKIEKKIFEEV